MHVQTAGLDLVRGPLERRLVDAHAIREVGLEEVVVAARALGDGLREGEALGVGGEVRQRAHVAAGEDQGFERPGRPPRAYQHKVLVRVDQALAFGQLERSVVD